MNVTTTHYVVAAGSPFAAVSLGLALHGPFATDEQAQDFALNSLAADSEWSVVPLVSLPADGDGDGAGRAEFLVAGSALVVLEALVARHPQLLDAEQAAGAGVDGDLTRNLMTLPLLLAHLRNVVAPSSPE